MGSLEATLKLQTTVAPTTHKFTIQT